MENKNNFFTFVLPFLIIIVAIGILVLLVKSRTVPEKKPRAATGALVRTMTVTKENRRAQIHSTGTVTANQQIAIVPQVGGQVTKISPQCVAGGFIKKGDLLFAIDDADYRLSVEQARAVVAKAEADLAIVQGQAEVARREWKRFGEMTVTASPLVLHEPQLKTGMANLAAAQAGLKKAQLNLDRTEVRAPFNCLVIKEELDPGLNVRAGSPVATIVGTDEAEVIAPLPLSELPWCVIPHRNNDKSGSNATLSATIGDRQYSWQGKVTRALGEVDPKGRMARLAIRINDPYYLDSNRNGNLDLIMGMFVDVTIHGHPINNVAVLPRKAIRPESTVWLIDKENKLRLRKVTVVRLTDNDALISKGLSPGDEVVLTNLNGAADGMALRPMIEGDKP